MMSDNTSVMCNDEFKNKLIFYKVEQYSDTEQHECFCWLLPTYKRLGD